MSEFESLISLHEQVRIVLEAQDKYGNLVGSVYYDDGGEAKNLALELVKNVSISGKKSKGFCLALHARVLFFCTLYQLVSVIPLRWVPFCTPYKLKFYIIRYNARCTKIFLC